MAKPLKRSNKLAAKCFGLSSSKKAPIMSARVADKRMSSTSADGGGRDPGLEACAEFA
jgi:hypothetical protein